MSISYKATSVEDFYTGFGEKPTKIVGKPTYADIDALRAIIYTNAASIPSTRGGGHNGHLGMVMPPASYAQLVPTEEFTLPTLPALPAFDNLTAAQIASRQTQYALDLKEFQEYTHLDRALIKLIAPAMEDIYLKPLQARHVGLLNRTTSGILVWLMATYGRISERQISDNRKRLQEAYDPNEEPFQVLIDRFDTVQQFATDANLPISGGELINEGLLLLKKSGVLTRPIELWKEKAPQERATWAQFTTHFMERIEEYQADRDTAGSHGYGALALQEEHIEQFVNHMADQQANQARVTSMMDQQQQVLALLTTQAEQIRALQQQIAAMPASGGNQHNGDNQRNGGNNGGQQQNPPANQRRPFVDRGHYCWTHGWTASHPGNECTTRMEGHQNNATRDNMMGGSTKGRDRIQRAAAGGAGR